MNRKQRRVEARLGKQQNDIRIVMGEAAMLSDFRHSSGVDDADVRSDDDVRGTRVSKGIIELQIQGGSSENLTLPEQ